MLTLHVRNTTVLPISPRAAAAWIRSTSRSLGKRSGEVSLLLCGDARCVSANRLWFGREYPTDVIAFPLHEDGYWGDILVNLRQARRQAKRLGVPFREEVRRLVVHGLLHLHGFDHTADRGEMEALQEKLLRRA